MPRGSWCTRSSEGVSRCSCTSCPPTAGAPTPHYCWACGIHEDFVSEPAIWHSLVESGQKLWASKMFLAAVAGVSAASLPLVAGSTAASPYPSSTPQLALLVGVFASVLLIILVNVLRVPNNQVKKSKPPSVISELPTADYLGSLLSGAIKLATVSYDKDSPDGMRTDPSKLLEFHTFLEAKFPLVHAAEPKGLRKTVVNSYSLLYEWRGSDPLLEPYMLCAHLDVVPTPDLDLWEHAPFAGVKAPDIEGRSCIWGRGAIDNKHNVLMQLAAVENLLKAGFRPKRTVFLAYGHDEEIGGFDGAKHIAELLIERNVYLDFILDEGPFIISGALPGLKDRHVAFVANCEKGFVNLKLTVDCVPSCHSSMPPAESSIGILANAVAKLERRPFPGHVGGFAETSLSSCRSDCCCCSCTWHCCGCCGYCYCCCC
ncbi:unnamed protein product [Polarella glacialis]|uniref:Peptidase M20 dimerisation domain-containing protein n=1 Tax=Polarella glacialis TaxID=89957 RepID=A0A813L0C9_POLGL|nr:unnamed protein product [Polarella glacialis]